MRKAILMAATAISLSAFSPNYSLAQGKGEMPIVAIKPDVKTTLINELVKTHGEANRFRIERGVAQAANFWYPQFGDDAAFAKFCKDKFISDPLQLNMLFSSFSKHWEVLIGHYNKMNLDLKVPVHIDAGEVTELDEIMSGYDPSAHLYADFFENQIAQYVALNFPFYTLAEKNSQGEKWSRQEWAYARMGDLFTTNLPSALLQNVSEISAQAANYISNYNICMGYLVDDKGNTFFPKDMKLITHWNLRDEIKSQYGNAKDGLTKQNMIYQVMKRIIAQDIPSEVINNTKYTWNPFSNKAFENGKEIKTTPEPNTRYGHLLANFHSRQALDKFSPFYPTYIKAKFEGEMEIPQEQVESMFVDFVSSPIAKNIASVIKKRLGRDLRPFDIWYDGFKSRSSINQDELNTTTKTKYPNPDAFDKDIPRILTVLGFNKDEADVIGSRIDVDPARGSGHAWGADMRTEKAHLRTRIAKEGMDYKGYNIAVHELGHNVEQTLTLYNVDNYMLRGVPNTAFTEAWAFTFQSRDLMLLGKTDPNPDKKYLEALDNFWSAYEIMGVSLVDMRVWKWMYANPKCTKEELNIAVNKIAREVWNSYYAPVFGIKDEPLLAIYSHMIENPLYLSAYPIGHLIEFQMNEYMEGKVIGTEMKRMLVQGRLTPEVWMKGAVGKGISTEPMLKAAEEALKHIK